MRKRSHYVIRQLGGCTPVWERVDWAGFFGAVPRRTSEFGCSLPANPTDPALSHRDGKMVPVAERTVTLGPMRVSTILALCLALGAATAQRARKPADVQILETKAVREGANISLDGKVRVIGEKSLRGLVIIFDFRSPEKQIVTSQSAIIDEDTLVAGREGVFHSEMADSARAVRYTLRAFDIHERELRVANPGPYPVE